MSRTCESIAELNQSLSGNSDLRPATKTGFLRGTFWPQNKVIRHFLYTGYLGPPLVMVWDTLRNLKHCSWKLFFQSECPDDVLASCHIEAKDFLNCVFNTCVKTCPWSFPSGPCSNACYPGRKHCMVLSYILMNCIPWSSFQTSTFHPQVRYLEVRVRICFRANTFASNISKYCLEQPSHYIPGFGGPREE